MKCTRLGRALCATPALLLAIACGSSNDGGLFGGENGGSSSGGASGSGGTGLADAGGTAGSPGTGGTASGGQSGSAGTPGSGGISATGGSAGSAGSGGAPGYTLDNVCAKFSAAICKAREGCCTSVFGFDAAQCVKNETSECQDKVKEVSAGNATFNPQHIDGCLAQATPVLQACQFHAKGLAEYLEVQNACRAIFDPKKQPGAACQEDGECATAPLPHGVSGCGDQSGKCYQTSVAQAGQKCDQTVYCASGTRCSSAGVCTPVKAGDSCYGGSSGCGFGLYCSSNKCQEAKASGSCYSSYYCQSLTCQSYQCVPPWPVVSERSCGKSG